MRLKPLFLIPGLLAILSLVRVSGSELVINEFMAENRRGIRNKSFRGIIGVKASVASQAYSTCKKPI